MEKLVKQLRQDYPNLSFRIGSAYCWSPKHAQVSYALEEDAYNIEGLLHELGHARLRHQNYASDIDLLRKEVEAWGEARGLAKQYGVNIDENHIEDCLDTYRDWLHKRSACPQCHATGIQQSERRYACLNCGHNWQVTASRFCRPYRRSKPTKNDQD
jgi:hypothetical protein